MNFYSLTIGHLVKTSGSSDFTNVDCIYIYHDPINDPDPQFRYPNNIMLSEYGQPAIGRDTLCLYETISGKLFYYNKNNVALYYLGHIPVEDLPQCTCPTY